MTLSTFGDWRTINFLGERGDKRMIKIDFMFDEIVATETLRVGLTSVSKASDIDIVTNKCQRLSEIDMFDIEFLLRKNGLGDHSSAGQKIAATLAKKVVAKGDSIRNANMKLSPMWSKKSGSFPVLRVLLTEFPKYGK